MTQPWMRQLPNGKPISALGFGCSSLWAKPGYDEDDAQAVLQAAVDGGINHFDTASSYGPGHGERRLGTFLSGRNPDDFVISTKVGGNFLDGTIQRGFDTALISRSFGESLNRLGLDRVDILYLHGPQESDLTDELMRFFEDEKARGRISYCGLESPHLGIFEKLPSLPIDVAMLHYNAVDQSAETLIQTLCAAGKFIISGTSLAQAKFAFGTFVPTSKHSIWYLLRMIKNDPLFFLQKRTMAQQLSQMRDSPHAAAIGFVTGHPLITSSLFGSSSVAHVAGNAKAGHNPLTVEECAALIRAAQT
jgi:aryl-alcohol dehydrogenase-like predicted oxidoreductase